MDSAKSIIVAKRDGSIESFSRNKLRRSLMIALRACRYHAKLADAMVDAVEVHLAYWNEPRPPTTEYLTSCVLSVLRQTGLKEVAETMTAYRRWRRLKRRSVRVLREDAAQGARPWRKTTVARALENDYCVSRETARIVAGELETRVLNLGLPVISEPLLEELMRNELMAWGLLDRQPPMSTPREPQERR